MLSAFIKSTIEVRHSSFSFCAATALSRIGATSTVAAGAADALADDEAAPPEAVAVAAPLAGVALAEVPKIALMIFPKMLIAHSLMNPKIRVKTSSNPGRTPTGDASLVRPTYLA